MRPCTGSEGRGWTERSSGPASIDRSRPGAADPAPTLELLLLARSGTASLDRWPGLVTRMLRGGSAVGEVAAELGWGPRLRHRRSLETFGYSLQLLRRILRLQRAVAMARSGGAPAHVAGRCGYADQAHPSRETRSLAGVDMGRPL